ncbi:MAG: carbohydrate kinase family protein, partial [Lachnoanaerobaculum sp.]|nr:carbohydrate kinase family protein [Lachnoanaerobaculum sp.]
MDRKIIVAGHISYDITPQIYDTKGKNFGKLLKPGKLINVGRATVANGGAVNNTGMALHKFGANVDLIAKVGDDEFGRQIIEKCEEKGAKTNFIKAVGEDTSYTIVLSPPGFDRSFLHFPGTNDTFKFSDLNMEKIKNAYFFHFGYPTLMAGFYKNNAKDLIEMYKSIKEAGLITSLDVAAID